MQALLWEVFPPARMSKDEVPKGPQEVGGRGERRAPKARTPPRGWHKAGVANRVNQRRSEILVTRLIQHLVLRGST